MTIPSYSPGAYRIPLTFTWRDSDGALIDFASGWTFEARIGFPGREATITKTGGITGAATAPNLTVDFDDDDLDDLTKGVWEVEIYPTETATGETQPPARKFIRIENAIQPVA